MAVSWTVDQKNVIDSRGGNLLVSAAAGSGKTAVLVERIIQLILDEKNPVDIDHLLVMTFTKAAAAEMKERIQAAIDKKLAMEPENKRLKRQSVMVDYAQITTIDSFCLNLIREHFDRTELDPGFRVADEGEMLLLRGEVMSELLEQEYEIGRSSFKDFIEAYASGKTDAGIEDLIEKVYNYAQSFPWPYEWFEQALKTIEEENASDGAGPILDYVMADTQKQIREWIRQLEEYRSICNEDDGPVKYLEAIVSDIAGFEGLLKAADYEELSMRFRALTFAKLATIRKTDANVNPSKKDLVQNGRNKIKDFWAKLEKQYFFDSPANITADMKLGNAGITELLTLAKAYTAMLDEAKREKNIVDFNDLEHFALKVLIDEADEKAEVRENADMHKSAGGHEKRPSAVADELAREYGEILVDEYQDSNYVQETLIQALSAERFGRPNVFTVGDVKQSIYQFRQARPEIFLDKYNRYPLVSASGEVSGNEDGGACGDGSGPADKKIELRQNFRSRSEVLESINDVFYGIMCPAVGGVDYNEEAALYPGASYAAEEDDYQTELLIAETDTDGDEDLGSKELEAAMIADRIRKLTDAETGMMVYDKEADASRRAAFGDVVILLRTVTGWAEEFTEVLGRHGIPAVSEKKTGYFSAEEIELVLSLLSVIDNPMQDIPFAAVCKSPFIGFTDGELAEIAAYYKQHADQTMQGLYSELKNYVVFAGEPIRSKGLKLFALLQDFEKKAVYMPMHELLYYIFDVTDYYRYASALPGGEVRKANLDMLVEKASAYEKTSYRGVFHFIRYIEKLKKYDTDFGEAAAAGEQNAVRIMSIHKSKGLEFPIVFVAGCSKRFNKTDQNGKVVIDSEFGIGSDFIDTKRRIKGTTLKKNVVRKSKDYSDMGEELRVLYVAMTRAREKLILTASMSKPEEKIEKLASIMPEGRRIPAAYIMSGGSYVDWILMSFQAGAVRIRREIVSVGRQIQAEETFMLSQAAQKLSYLALEDEELLYDQETYERARMHFFDYQYPQADDVNLRIKYSVSDLKKKDYEAALEEDEGPVALLPRFMSETEEEEGGGAMRGTAYHRVFELISYCGNTDIDFVKDEIARMVSEGKLSAEAAEMVRPQAVKKLLDSELGQRMLAASRRGRLYRERQFVIGFPACEILETTSKEYVVIQGIIDGYFEEDGELVLLDYKTDYVNAPEELVNRYKTQMDLYARALTQMTGLKVKEKRFWSTRLGEILI